MLLFARTKGSRARSDAAADTARREYLRAIGQRQNWRQPRHKIVAIRKSKPSASGHQGVPSCSRDTRESWFNSKTTWTGARLGGFASWTKNGAQLNVPQKAAHKKQMPHNEARRLVGRSVKGAQCAFIGAKRETLYRAVQAQVFSRKGRRNPWPVQFGRLECDSAWKIRSSISIFMNFFPNLESGACALVGTTCIRDLLGLALVADSDNRFMTASQALSTRKDRSCIRKCGTFLILFGVCDGVGTWP